MKFLLQNKVTCTTENKLSSFVVHRTRYISTKFEVRSFNTTLNKAMLKSDAHFRCFFFAEYNYYVTI